MFQSLTYHHYDKILDQHIYKLIDSDFESEINMDRGFGYGNYALNFSIKIAKEYEKRNLNVAVNLALCYKYNFNYIDLEIKNSSESVKEFYKKYLSDIKKYMALL